MELENIYIVTWESNVDGDKETFIYPCATEEIAKAYFNQCKAKVLSDGHFTDMTEEELKNCEVSDYDTIFFIKDEHNDYWDDVSIVSMPIIKSLP